MNLNHPVRQGDCGDAVGLVHQELLEHGFDLPDAELNSSAFGDGTRAAVLRLQAEHYLEQDGVVGPKTWALLLGEDQTGRLTDPGWRIIGNVEPVEVRRALRMATEELGAREEPAGSNRGPKVDRYTGMYGMPSSVQGPPWCAMFVWWCYRYAGVELPKRSALASALKWREWGRATGGLVAPSETLPGDVFVILREGGHGHCGLIASVDGSRACTIEGNAGQAVRGKIRDISSFASVVRVVHP